MLRLIDTESHDDSYAPTHANPGRSSNPLRVRYQRGGGRARAVKARRGGLGEKTFAQKTERYELITPFRVQRLTWIVPERNPTESTTPLVPHGGVADRLLQRPPEAIRRRYSYFFLRNIINICIRCT
ncbi:hypothetical protein EVAR_99461_1 [Eumeta japonica]|uniref:Uncharacterized protein n=1 Tax=Eumeta variegata TaxID=151549 RepID=A0A4C1Z145_EUMVA|nr:hypothetical protein EVAR_99461_1 [Eumeta japonica]